MVYYLIICRSLTYAQRTAKVLERAGITAVVTKIPNGISTNGCGYCVKVSERRISDALIALNDAGLGNNRIFILTDDGTSREVFL